jgi:hypothetical protein
LTSRYRKEQQNSPSDSGVNPGDYGAGTPRTRAGCLV